MCPDEAEGEDEEELPEPKVALEESAYEFEDRFKALLETMGLTDVGGGRTFTIGGHQIDACGAVGDSLIVFDCTIKRGTKATSKQLRNKIEQWRGKYPTLLEGVRSHPDYSKYSELAVSIAANATVSEADLRYASEGNPKIRILNRQNIEYLTEIANDIGIYARYRLASILAVPIKRTALKVPAIKILDRGKSLYLLAARAKDLAELAFVPQAEAGFKFFYQRLIKKGKLRAIKEYVEEFPRPFPNSVILAVSRDPVFVPSKTPILTLSGIDLIEGELGLPQEYGSCWVVDGQHRIYGSAIGQGEIVLPVALIPANDHEKAKYFLDINSNQTKIDPNLKWDLSATLVPEEVDGKISRAVQLLDVADGPLRGKIRIPHKGIGRAKPVKLSGLCDAVYRNKLYQTQQYDYKSDQFVNHLSADYNSWLTQVDAEVPEEATKSRFLFDNSGLSVLTILFKRIAKRLETRRPSLAVLNSYAKALGSWLKQNSTVEIGALARRCSSEAGRSEVANLAASAMNENLPVELQLELTAEASQLPLETIRFEADVRAGLNELFSAKIGPDWFSRINLGNSGRPPESADKLTLGQIRSIMQRDPFLAIIRTMFEKSHVKPDLGFHLFEYVGNYRNDSLHGNYSELPKYDPQLVESGMKTLRRCFGLGA